MSCPPKVDWAPTPIWWFVAVMMYVGPSVKRWVWWRKWVQCPSLSSHLTIDTYVKPVNGTAVDEGRILADVVTERVSNWTESDDDVQVLTTAIDEKRKELKRRQFRTVSCVLVSSRPDCLQNQFNRYHVIILRDLQKHRDRSTLSYRVVH